MRPTKFELMRLNRKKADARSRNAYRAESPSGGRGLQTLAAAVHTMEIDGVKYREEPELCGCIRCAFWPGDEACANARGIAKRTYGGDCGQRSVVYIKAE